MGYREEGGRGVSDRERHLIKLGRVPVRARAIDRELDVPRAFVGRAHRGHGERGGP